MEDLKGTLDRVTARINTQASEKKSILCRRCSKEFEQYEYDCIYCEPCVTEIKKEREEARITQEIERVIPKIYHGTESDRNLKDSLNRSVFCHGPAGTGKTQFVASLAKHYIRNRQGVIWQSYPTYIMRLQTMFRNESKDPFEYVMQTAESQKVLVIDDIGIEKLTDFVRQITYMLINERYQRQLVTLITSNKTLAEIDALIHPGIASRIAGMCQVLAFSGRDLRLGRRIS